MTPFPPSPAQWGACSDRGSVRQINEDGFAAQPGAGVWAVADGMGGHARGDQASQRLVEEISSLNGADSLAAIIQNTRGAITRANDAIFAESLLHGAMMGSTVVCLVLHDAAYGLIWVGDSRGYLLRDGRLSQLTRDHSQVQALVDRGELTAREALDHPMRHVLTQAVGVEQTVRVDGITGETLAGDIFLLCSDGVYGALSDEEMQAVLTGAAPEEAASRLIAKCLETGADDNITALVVHPYPLTQTIAAAAAQSHEARP